MSNHQFKDIGGIKFGLLTAERYVETRRVGKCLKAFWSCKCDCGNTTIVPVNALRSGNTKSCGCYHKKRISECADLIGQRFERLIVIARAERPSTTRAAGSFWLCRCDCGKEVVSWIGSLRRGSTKSCGCLNDEKIGNLRLSHGHTRNRTQSPEYRTYRNMLKRCLDENDKSYPRYGGRGITVSETWQECFDNFLKDMGNRPDGLTLERVDNEKGYCKENCKWATRHEQMMNRHVTKKCDGRFILDISKDTGIHYYTILNRWKAGDRNERLTRPVLQRKQRIKA
jgi:hypothetical protein